MLGSRTLPVVLAIGLLSTAPSAARGSCGAEDCPLDLRGSQGRRFSFDLNYQYIDQDHIRVGSRSGVVGELPSPEDEVETVSRTVTGLGQARVTERFGLSASLPFIDRRHRHIANEEGSPPELREWNYSGIGDATVIGQFSAAGVDGAALKLSLQLGAKLPTGKRHVETVGGEEPEPTARPGTGSYDLLAGLHLMRRLGMPDLHGERVEAPMFLSLLGRRNSHGTDDYRIGNELQVNAGGFYPMTRVVHVLGQINARVRGKDDPGATDALRDNTGGTWIYATPGLRWVTSPTLSVYGYAQIPVYQHVNRIQLVAPYHLLIGTTFALGE